MSRKLANVNNIIGLYKKGYGTQKIAEIEGVHRSTVQYTLKSRGIELRKRSPVHHYDVDFFTRYTKDSCYWAGFVMSDGHVHKNKRMVDLHLSSRDIGHLSKFSDVINYEGNIAKCADSSVRLSICGNWFVNDLYINFGIGCAKSLTCRFPYTMPQNFYSHFIRGLFDGDGCVTYTTVPTINFTSNFCILSSLREVFYSIVGVRIKRKGGKPKITNKGKYGQLFYSGANAAKVAKWLYFCSGNNNRMNRKFNRCVELNLV